MLVDTLQVMGALGSLKRLKILQLLCNDDLSSMEVYKRFSINDKDIHRETVYRDLERLVSVDLVSKYYDIKNKKILYKSNARKLTINLCDLNILSDSS